MSVKERIWSWISNWKNKFPSQAGREILLKAMAQAIPTYTMSIFLFPKTLLREINAMMSRYWWGNHEKELKIHWIKREKMRISKNQGGMGFCDMESFNKALLAKQCWRILQNIESLSAKILKVKYFQQGTILDAKLRRRPSYVWRSIWSARELLKVELLWRAVNGGKI